MEVMCLQVDRNMNPPDHPTHEAEKPKPGSIMVDSFRAQSKYYALSNVEFPFAPFVKDSLQTELVCT